MLVGHKASEINLLLKAIQKHPKGIITKLNYGRCNYIAMNGKAHMPFSDGKPMKQVDEATYLRNKH